MPLNLHCWCGWDRDWEESTNFVNFVQPLQELNCLQDRFSPPPTRLWCTSGKIWKTQIRVEIRWGCDGAKLSRPVATTSLVWFPLAEKADGALVFLVQPSNKLEVPSTLMKWKQAYSRENFSFSNLKVMAVAAHIHIFLSPGHFSSLSHRTYTASQISYSRIYHQY